MNCPTGKHEYQSAQDAARAVRLVLGHAQPRKYGAGRLAHYRCRQCGNWHIGHNKPGEKRA